MAALWSALKMCDEYGSISAEKSSNCHSNLVQADFAEGFEPALAKPLAEKHMHYHSLVQTAKTIINYPD